MVMRCLHFQMCTYSHAVLHDESYTAKFELEVMKNMVLTGSLYCVSLLLVTRTHMLTWTCKSLHLKQTVTSLHSLTAGATPQKPEMEFSL